MPIHNSVLHQHTLEGILASLQPETKSRKRLRDKRCKEATSLNKQAIIATATPLPLYQSVHVEMARSNIIRPYQSRDSNPGARDMLKSWESRVPIEFLIS